MIVYVGGAQTCATTVFITAGINVYTMNVNVTPGCVQCLDPNNMTATSVTWLLVDAVGSLVGGGGETLRSGDSSTVINATVVNDILVFPDPSVVIRRYGFVSLECRSAAPPAPFNYSLFTIYRNCKQNEFGHNCAVGE